MLSISLDKSGLDVLIGGVSRSLGELNPVFQDIHSIVLDMEKKQFETEGGWSGDGWVPLSPSYAAWKKSNHPSKDMMRITDRLYKSLVSKSHEEHVYETGPNWVEIGTRVPYARAHQYGYAPRNLPARIIVPRLTKAEGERVVDAVLKHVLRGARRGPR
jgi:phage gpG-like protein